MSTSKAFFGDQDRYVPSVVISPSLCFVSRLNLINIYVKCLLDVLFMALLVFKKEKSYNISIHDTFGLITFTI